MEARTPEQLHPPWVQAHNVGDLNGMMALCEPGFASSPGQGPALQAQMRFEKPTEQSWRRSLGWSPGPQSKSSTAEQTSVW